MSILQKYLVQDKWKHVTLNQEGQEALVTHLNPGNLIGSLLTIQRALCGTIFVKLSYFRDSGTEDVFLKNILFSALAAFYDSSAYNFWLSAFWRTYVCFYFEFLARGPGYSSCHYFIQWRGIICTILVEVIMGNICRNYFEFGQVVLEMLLFFFYFLNLFLALVAILFSRVEPFAQFW